MKLAGSRMAIAAAFASLSLPSSARAQGLNLTLDHVIDIGALNYLAVGGIAFDPTVEELWICDAGQINTVERIDIASGAVSVSFSASAIPGMILGPDALARGPQTGNLFLFSTFGRSVGGVVTPAGQLVSTLPGSFSAGGATFNSAGELFVVEEHGVVSNNVRILRLDSQSGQVLEDVEIALYTGRASDLAWDPVTGNLFVYADSTNELLEIDFATGNILSRTGVAPFIFDSGYPAGLAFNPTGTRLYLSRGNLLGAERISVLQRLLPPVIYCTGKVNSLGCTPALATSGLPSTSAGNGFEIAASQMLNNQFAMLFYSTTAGAAIPFHGGTLCMQAPLERTFAVSTGGNPPPADCSGVPEIDFNAFVAGGSDPSLVAGVPVWCQFFSRDPLARFGDSLSDAVVFSLAP